MNIATASLAPTNATCCEALTVEAVSPAHAERVARVFKVLGDPTRVMLLSLIATSPEGEACICDLTGPVGLSQPTVSHHMKQLSDAGLVTREQRGKWAYFRAMPGAIDEITNALGFIVRVPKR
ncbi:ArsR/SmtB family transcription factor [Changpingibacter yushuensis]|uniref:ArsR/SmtB family transcription factor n=1 Tax=Changpingibacter yushuensis TaxID=2758440 RepID=UPI00165E0469|nr:metalloregulator ArsR/SmtB family transcription factor [Changpingibacter yushuensis]